MEDNHLLESLDRQTGGRVLEELTVHHHDFMTVQRRLALCEEQRIIQLLARVEAVANRQLGGLRPEVEIPLRVQAWWAAKFKAEDRAAGIRNSTGYECWDDKGREGFLTRWKKHNPGLCYTEQRPCAQSSIIVPATRWTPARSVPVRSAPFTASVQTPQTPAPPRTYKPCSTFAA